MTLAQFAERLAPDNGPPASPASIVVRARGDDEWCALTVNGKGAALDALLDGRSLEAWIGAQPPMEAATRLQAAGIAAAPMLRVADLPDFAYCRERGSFRVDPHPHLVESVISERMAAVHRHADLPPARPAPLMGEQSEDVAREWLDLSDPEIAALHETGVLQPTEPAVFETIAACRAATLQAKSAAPAEN